MDCGMDINWVLIEVQRHYAIIKLLVLSKKCRSRPTVSKSGFSRTPREFSRFSWTPREFSWIIIIIFMEILEPLHYVALCEVQAENYWLNGCRMWEAHGIISDNVPKSCLWFVIHSHTLGTRVGTCSLAREKISEKIMIFFNDSSHCDISTFVHV